MSWFLILMVCANQYAFTCSVTTIPKPYATFDDCQTAGKAMKNIENYRCVEG